AKVHPKALDFPRPVTKTQPPLCTVAHYPTGINLRMTEGLGSGEQKAATTTRNCAVDIVRSVYLDLAVSQPPGEVGHHLPIPPHITDAGTRRAEPIYLCRVVRNHCSIAVGFGTINEREALAQIIGGVSFESAFVCRPQAPRPKWERTASCSRFGHHR